MFARAWKLFGRILLIIGLLLTFIVFIELLRIFIFLHRFSSILAWTYVAVLSGSLLAGLLYTVRGMMRYPRSLKPPPPPEIDEATHYEMRGYVRYLMRYLQRLAGNPGITEEQRKLARRHVDEIRGTLKAHPLNDDLVRMIQQTEGDVIAPILNTLDAEAEREVRRSVRDVMIGVTLSPYHSMDLLIVLYRNTAMVRRIVGIYSSRPAPREQFRTLRDVMRVVATVNFLYIGRNLLENLFAFVPVIGRITDDIGQGLGAGLFTSAAGHAAMHRCAAFRGWNKQEAAESLGANMKVFVKDVKNIFTKDVLPDIKGRIMAEAPAEKAQQPGFWEQVNRGIGTALDSTMKATGDWIVKPAVAGAQGMMFGVQRDAPPPAESPSTGSPRPPDHASGSRHRRRRRRHRKRNGGMFRIFRTFGQRLKYTFQHRGYSE